MLRTATQKGRLILAIGSVVAAVAGGVALRADLMVGYAFNKALETQKPVRPFEIARSNQWQPPQVGDEGFWLNPAGTHLAVVMAKDRLAVGDRIAITADGHVRRVEDRRRHHLEVVGIVGAPLLEVVAKPSPGVRILVTCRIVDPGEPESRALVQFVVEVDVPKPTRSLQPPPDPLGRT
jgi:hypothetical protein